MKRETTVSLISSPVRTSRNNYSGWLFAHSVPWPRRDVYIYRTKCGYAINTWAKQYISFALVHAQSTCCRRHLRSPLPPSFSIERLLQPLLGPRRGRKPRSQIARNPSYPSAFACEPCPTNSPRCRAVWHLTSTPCVCSPTSGDDVVAFNPLWLPPLFNPLRLELNCPRFSLLFQWNFPWYVGNVTIPPHFNTRFRLSKDRYLFKW